MCKGGWGGVYYIGIVLRRVNVKVKWCVWKEVWYIICLGRRMRGVV
jgi:hypothetical protein